MPLEYIEISSFKSIVQQRLDFGRVNVFIGTNGSGKSNLLEAIGVLSCALSGEVSHASLAKRGVRLSSPQLFTSSFRSIERKNAFALEAKMGKIRYKASIAPKDGNRFHYETEDMTCPQGKACRQQLQFDKAAESDGLLDASEGMIPEVVRSNEFDHRPIGALRNYAIYTPNTLVFRGATPNAGTGEVREAPALYSGNAEPLGLHGGKLAVALQDVIEGPDKQRQTELEEFLHTLGWFGSVDVSDRIPPQPLSSHADAGNWVVKYRDKFMHGEYNELPPGDVSEGALYALFVLVLLLHKNSPHTFALDNADSALNPNLARDLMRHIIMAAGKQDERQLFITTHNPTALDAVDLFDNDQRLFAVDRNREGHTEVRRVDPPKGFTRDKWVEKHGGMRLSEIWLAGLIGGDTAGF